jgi:hypothetical protein
MNFQRCPELGRIPPNCAPVLADAFKEEQRYVEFGRGNGIGRQGINISAVISGGIIKTGQFGSM